MSVGTFAANLRLHLGRCRVMLTSDVGLLLSLGLHLLLLGSVRGHLLEHDAFGEYVFCVHTVRGYGLFRVGLFAVKLEVIIKLVLKVLHLVDIFIFDGNIIILTHSTQFVL